MARYLLEIFFEQMHSNYVLVSGGFDPIHSGHISLLRQASEIGKVIVILNTNQFLLSKKEYFLWTFLKEKLFWKA